MISDDLASNVTQINTNLEQLESKLNVSVSPDVEKFQQKLDEFESEQIPALKKDRIEIRKSFSLRVWSSKQTPSASIKVSLNPLNQVPSFQ